MARGYANERDAGPFSLHCRACHCPEISPTQTMRLLIDRGFGQASSGRGCAVDGEERPPSPQPVLSILRSRATAEDGRSPARGTEGKPSPAQGEGESSATWWSCGSTGLARSRADERHLSRLASRSRRRPSNRRISRVACHATAGDLPRPVSARAACGTASPKVIGTGSELKGHRRVRFSFLPFHNKLIDGQDYYLYGHITSVCGTLTCITLMKGHAICIPLGLNSPDE